MSGKEFKFTKGDIKKLPLPNDKNERVRYYDTETRGLCLRVTATGTKSFTFYRKVNGKPMSLKLGDFPDMTVEQARGKAEELNSRIAKGERLWEQAEKKKDELTLEELFCIYIERHAQKIRKSWATMERDFDRFAKPVRHKKLSEITHGQAESLHVQLGKDRGKYAANRAIQLLKAVFNKGKAWKLHDCDNPFVGITLFEEKPRNRFLSQQEARRLLKALDGPAEDDDLRDFIKLSLFTGVRKSNVFGMRWVDVDLDADEPRWEIPDTKNGTTQIIALGSNEIKILSERRSRAQNGTNSKNPFVFPGDGRTGHLTDVKRSWTTFRKKIGIEDCTIHDLRRSLGAAMASNNVNVSIIKSALNHKDMKTTINVYALTHKEAELIARTSVQQQWLDDQSS